LENQKLLALLRGDAPRFSEAVAISRLVAGISYARSSDGTVPKA